MDSVLNDSIAELFETTLKIAKDGISATAATFPVIKPCLAIIISFYYLLNKD